MFSPRSSKSQGWIWLWAKRNEIDRTKRKHFWRCSFDFCLLAARERSTIRSAHLCCSEIHSWDEPRIYDWCKSKIEKIRSKTLNASNDANERILYVTIICWFTEKSNLFFSPLLLFLFLALRFTVLVQSFRPSTSFDVATKMVANECHRRIDTFETRLFGAMQNAENGQQTPKLSRH